ncbi:MAG: hypothetical protein R2909_00735 [Gemmatimonadales bacterium]
MTRRVVASIILRGHPAFLFVDAGPEGDFGLDLVRSVKSDAFTAIIPTLILCGQYEPSSVQAWFAAGADEILTDLFPREERRARLEALLIRSERDVSVHPSTRLPGAPEIDRDIRKRLRLRGELRGLLRRPRSSRSTTTATAITTAIG